MLKILIIAFTLLATACTSSTGHMYSADGTCLTCWNNPVTGEPINHDGETEAVSSKEVAGSQDGATKEIKQTAVKTKQEFSIIKTTPASVDVAFIRIKKEFGYLTVQEVEQLPGRYSSILKSPYYAFDVLPGVYYHMKKDIKIGGTYILIDTFIEKTSDTETKLTIKYWRRQPGDLSNNIHAIVNARIGKALSI